MTDFFREAVSLPVLFFLRWKACMSGNPGPHRKSSQILDGGKLRPDPDCFLLSWSISFIIQMTLKTLVVTQVISKKEM